ncbi:MAG: hypothetical protein ACI8P0_003304 [Planctomycetaceae bacterium]
MIDLVQTERGILLPVKAQAGARKNGITGQHDGALKVSVTQAPEKGKANKALAKVIAAELGLKNSQIEIGSGGTSSSKSFVIIGIELTDLNSRLQDHLES